MLKSIKGSYDRRDFIRIAFGATGFASWATLLQGCGGGTGTSSSGQIATPQGSNSVSVSVNRDEIGGTNLYVRSAMQAEAPVLTVTVSGTGAQTAPQQVPVAASDQNVQLILLSDDAGKVRGLALSVPDTTSTKKARSAPSSISFDAVSTALSLVYMTAGIISTDPSEWGQRAVQIKGLASFLHIAVFLVRELRNNDLNTLTKRDDLQQLLQTCIQDWQATFGSTAKAAAKNRATNRDLLGYVDFDANAANQHYSDSLRVFLENRGWRYVYVTRQTVDASNKEIAMGTAFPMEGATSISWGSLFTHTVNQPTKMSEDVSIKGRPAIAAIKYWVQGPGVTSMSEGLPPSVPSMAEKAWYRSVVGYLLFPVLDAISGGLPILHDTSKVLAISSQIVNAIEGGVGYASFQQAMDNGDIRTAGAKILDALFAGITFAVTVPEAFSVGKYVALLWEAIAGLMGAANVLLAVESWSLNPKVAHVEVPLSRDSAGYVKVENLAGNPPFNWTYGDIPFSEYRTNVRVGDTSGVSKASELLPSVLANAVHVMQKTSNSSSVPNGTTVGRITIYAADGSRLKSQDLIEGQNTAEWAWEREDQLGHRPQHSLPDTPYAQWMVDASLPRGGFNVRHFYLRFDIRGYDDEPVVLGKIELEMFPSGLPSNFGIDIYGITVAVEKEY